MWTYNYTYPNYLAHYGIKGMKWGIRRYQNADGTLTAAGKAREAMLDAKADVKKHSYGTKAYTNATLKYKNLQRQFKDAKDREALQSKTKSKHQLALEEKYKARGSSASEAELQAYRRVKGERLALAAGAIAVAGLAAYVGYKHYDEVTDKVISGNLYRVTNTKVENLDTGGNYYYQAKTDKKRYMGLYANQRYTGAYGFKDSDVYNKTVNAASKIKVASPKNAQNIIYNELVKNDAGSRKTLSATWEAKANQYAQVAPKKAKMLRQAARDVAANKNTRSVYEAVNDEMSNTEVRKLVGQTLKKHGYDAVRDVNDHKYSGFGAKNPVVVFSKEKLSDVATSRIDPKKAAELTKQFYAEKTVKELGKTAAAVGGVAGGATAASKASTARSENRFVENYRSEHPNSKLSRNEILAIRDKQLLED